MQNFKLLVIKKIIQERIKHIIREEESCESYLKIVELDQQSIGRLNPNRCTATASNGKSC